MRKVKNKTGFSLIELSIVMLLIGILVAGISQGSILKKNMTLNSARSLTSGSPVNAIPNLIAWYETTLESSFNEFDKIDEKNLTNLNDSAWKDNSPSKDNNAVSGAGLSASYSKYAINDLPAIKFNGTNSFLTFNHVGLVGRYYTIFVVERRKDVNQNPIVGFGTAGYVGYSNNTTLFGANLAGTKAIPGFGGEVPRILTFLQAPQIPNTKGIFVNGGDGSVAKDSIADATASNQNLGTIGRANGEFYNGDIAEIIIFNRSLDLIERNAIQKYLSDKYKINVSVSS